MVWEMKGYWKPFSMLKSDYSMTGIVSPVFQEPWGINTTGCVKFKGKSHHGYLYILKNLKNLSPKKLLILRTAGWVWSKQKAYIFKKIAVAGSSRPSNQICKADGLSQSSLEVWILTHAVLAGFASSFKALGDAGLAWQATGSAKLWLDFVVLRVYLLHLQAVTTVIL